MRKLIFALIALLGFSISVAAQQVAPKTTKKTEKAAKELKKSDTKVVLKKDGTPDKRYKNNKQTKVNLKKDGTPDKRYKENK